MKGTIGQLTDLLTKLGVSVELVENEADADYKEDAAIQAIDKARTPIIKQIVSKDIHGQALRTVNDAYRKGLSTVTGLPIADMAELEGDALLTKALEHYKTSLPDTGKDAQAKIDKILADHKLALEGKEKEWGEKYTGLETKLTDKNMLDILAKYHREAKGLPEKANRDALAKAFLPYLRGQGSLKLTEDGTDIEIYGADGTRRLNANNTANLGVADYLKPYYSDLGMWNEDTRDVSAAAAAERAKSGLPAATLATDLSNPHAAREAYVKSLE